MDQGHGLTTPVIVALMGVAVPTTIAIIHAAFKIGGISVRVDALEKWRDAYQASIRGDMHEISDMLTAIRIEIGSLSTLVRERSSRQRVTDATIIKPD